jgi:hypothetical protein
MMESIFAFVRAKAVGDSKYQSVRRYARNSRHKAHDLDGEVIGTFSSQPLATRALGERP